MRASARTLLAALFLSLAAGHAVAQTPPKAPPIIKPPIAPTAKPPLEPKIDPSTLVVLKPTVSKGPTATRPVLSRPVPSSIAALSSAQTLTLLGTAAHSAGVTMAATPPHYQLSPAGGLVFLAPDDSFGAVLYLSSFFEVDQRAMAAGPSSEAGIALYSPKPSTVYLLDVAITSSDEHTDSIATVEVEEDDPTPERVTSTVPIQLGHLLIPYLSSSTVHDAYITIGGLSWGEMIDSVDITSTQ